MKYLIGSLDAVLGVKSPGNPLKETTKTSLVYFCSIGFL